MIARSYLQKDNTVFTATGGIRHHSNPPLRVRTSQWAEDLCRLKTSADPGGTQLLTQVRAMFLS